MSNVDRQTGSRVPREKEQARTRPGESLGRDDFAERGLWPQDPRRDRKTPEKSDLKICREKKSRS